MSNVNIMATLTGKDAGAFEMFDNFKREAKKAQEQSKSFNKEVGSAKGVFSQFSQGVGSMVAGLGLYDAALKAGSLALDGLNKAINSTQATGDAFNIMMDQGKAAMDEFFQSIATGDWSNLLDNMSLAIERGKELSETLDALGDVQFGYNVLEAERDDKRNELIDIINNSKDPKERKEALEKLKVNTEQGKKNAEALRIKLQEALDTSLGSSIGGDFDKKNLSRKQLDGLFNNYVLLQAGVAPSLNQKAKEIAKLKKQSANRPNAYEIQGAGASSLAWKNLDKKKKAADEADKKLALYKKLAPELYYAIEGVNNIIDDERKNLEAYATQLLGLKRKTTNEGKENLRYENRVNKGDSPKTPKPKPDKKKDPKVDFSKIDASVTAKAKAKELPPLSIAILPIFDRVKQRIEQLEKEIKPLRVALNMEVKGSDAYDKIKKQIEGKEQEINNIKKANNPTPTPPPQAPKTDLDKQMEDLNAMAGAVDSLASSFSFLNGEMENSALGWLKWGTNVVQAVATAVPKLATLVAAQTADATTKGAGAVASIPFVGPVLAIGAIASMLGAFASMPKFATGGVVGGNSYFGDKILARVNSGELILNNKQQRTIYDNLQSRVDKTQNINVGGDFHIRGNDLVLAYKRANNFLSRN